MSKLWFISLSFFVSLEAGSVIKYNWKPDEMLQTEIFLPNQIVGKNLSPLKQTH